MKEYSFFFFLFLGFCPISGMADVVFTAHPVGVTTAGCPIVIELTFENRSQTAESIDLGKDRRGGIDFISSEGTVYHNQCIPRGGLIHDGVVHLGGGKSIKMLVVLDEWVSLKEGKQFLKVMLPTAKSSQAKFEIDVAKNTPEALAACLVQWIKTAHSAPEWDERSLYLKAITRVYRSSDAGQKLIVEICNHLGFKEFPAEVTDFVRIMESREKAID